MDKAECLQHYQLRSHLTRPFQTHLRRLVFKDMHLQDIARPNWHPNVDLSSHSCLRWHTPPTQTNHPYLLHIINILTYSNTHFQSKLDHFCIFSFDRLSKSPTWHSPTVRHVCCCPLWSPGIKGHCLARMASFHHRWDSGLNVNACQRIRTSMQGFEHNGETVMLPGLKQDVVHVAVCRSHSILFLRGRGCEEEIDRKKCV